MRLSPLLIVLVLAGCAGNVADYVSPRTDIVAVPTEIGLAELIEVVVSEGHSRVPVYEETIDNIVGVVFAYDLFQTPTSLQAIMRPAHFVPEAPNLPMGALEQGRLASARRHVQTRRAHRSRRRHARRLQLGTGPLPASR